MTERTSDSLERTETSWELGGTRLEWSDGVLSVTFDERTRPFFQRMPRRLRGRITLTSGGAAGSERALDASGAHVWRPVAPAARASVEIDGGPSFEGPAYCDENAGHEGLEAAFRGWDWSRMETSDGTAVLYDVETRDGERVHWGRLFTREGDEREFSPEHRVALGSAGWGVPRSTRASRRGGARAIRAMVSAPFYSRSLIEVEHNGEACLAVHERLDMDRFESRWVRFLLPWRIRKER